MYIWLCLFNHYQDKHYYTYFIVCFIENNTLISPVCLKANQTIRIPREHHRFILGAKGAKLQELELQTATKITIPRADDNSDLIKIVGTKEGIDKAMHDIQVISDIQVCPAYKMSNVLWNYNCFS